MAVSIENRPQPVILFGALRSGTTMFRLILDHHPKLANLGETDFLLDHIHPDTTHPTGWRYDRAALAEDWIFRACGIELPEGPDGRDLLEALIAAIGARSPARRPVLVFHRNAPKIAALLPDLPVLHLMRDVRDVARSCVGMGWAGNSYYGARHWIETERGWDEAAMPADRVLELRFETLMQDIEKDLKRVCGFLGLEFSDRMLRYPETTTYGPPDPGIAQQWKWKAGPREIARIEARAGALLAARGYDPAGPRVRLGVAERLWLAADHRVRRWRFNIGRYGPGLFLGHHLARILGLSGLAKRLGDRQEAIRIANLK